MSYNVNKINNTQTTDDSISALSLSSIITVTSPSNGEFLSKASNNWETISLNSQQVNPSYALGPGNSYNVGVYYYGQTDNYIFYKPKEALRDSSVAYVNSSGSYVPVSNNNWFQSLTFDGTAFNGKTVILEGSIAPYAQTTMRAKAQWVNGYTNTYTALGPPSKLHGKSHADSVFGRFVGSGSNITVSLKFIYLNASNSSFLAGSTHHRLENIIIRVIG